MSRILISNAESKTWRRVVHIRTISKSASVILATVLVVFAVPHADRWRALIVYTNAVDSAEGYQPLYERL